MSEWLEIKCINCNVFLAKTPRLLTFKGEVVKNRLEKPHAIFCVNCAELVKDLQPKTEREE